MYSEREFTLPEAKGRIENWLTSKGIDFNLKTFSSKDSQFQIVRSFLTLNGQSLQVGNGKGIGKEPVVGAIFESVEHLVYFSQKHAKRVANIKEVLSQGSVFKQNVPMQFITNTDTKVNVDSFKSMDNDKRVYFPSFLSDTTYTDTEIALKYPDLLQYSSNNGYAIGATKTEATLHALNELIERDSVSRVLIKYGLGQHDSSVFATRLPIRILTGKLRQLANSIEETLDGKLTIVRIQNSLKIPCFLCVIENASHYSYPLYGSGASPSSHYALERALTETLQLGLLFDQEDKLLHHRLKVLWKKVPIVDNLLKFKFLEELIPDNNTAQPTGDIDLQTRTSPKLLVQDIVKCLENNGIEVFNRSILEDNLIAVNQVLIPSFSTFNLILEGSIVLPFSAK